MARKSVGFVDQHIEKVVLGVCAAALLGILVWYFALGPYGGDAGPLLAEASKAAEQAKSNWSSAKPRPAPESESSDQLLREIQQWYGLEADGLIKIAGLPQTASQTQPFPPLVLPVQGTAEQDRHGLARFVAPGVPIVLSGTSRLEMPARQYDIKSLLNQGLPDGDPRELSWVTVGAQLPIAKQLQNFYAAEYKPGELSLLIVEVQLQRKDVEAANADWEDVRTYKPYNPFPRPEVIIRDTASERARRDLRESIAAIGSTLGFAQDLIARASMPFPATENPGDRVDFRPIPAHPSDDLNPDMEGEDQKARVSAATSRSRDWLSKAKKALKGGKPFADVDPDAAWLLASAAASTKYVKKSDADKARDFIRNKVLPILKSKGRPVPTEGEIANAPEPEKLMPLYALDLTVIPGKTYVYRMRYEVYNVFAGNTDIMKDAQDARKLTLTSDWSPVSRSIEIKTDTYFYVTRAADAARKRQLTVTVFKKDNRGRWAKNKNTVTIGGAIGEKAARGDFTTSMICVDIVPKGPDDAILVYVNQKDGTVWERSYAQDQQDPRFKRLSKG